MPRDKILFLGKIKLRVLPGDLTLAEFMEWWPRLTEKERDRYTEYETRNLITTAGRSQVLTYIGAPNLSSPVVPFSQYFSVGTGPTLTVNPGDSHINTELTRLVPSTYTVSGNGVDISTFFGTSQGNGTWSNCGLYGNNATSTLGTGTLLTHALFSYVKTNTQTVTADYIITLS